MRKTVLPDSQLLLQPPPLTPGDTIGLFCPAGPVRDMGRVERGIAILQGMGFQTRILEDLQPLVDKRAYLSATDSVRSCRLETLWADSTVKALMAVRGGYGCLRLAALLNFNLFRKQPKFLIGFSDITVLLAANFAEIGLTGLHGPVVSSLAQSDEASKERLFSLLTGSFAPYTLQQTKSLQILYPGEGQGHIVIGNLTTLVHLIGTPWEPRFDGAILMLEDTGESMYKIDRMLTHLRYSERLARLSGLILGDFDMGVTAEPDVQFKQQLGQRVLELTESYRYPVWSNFPIGHQKRNQAIPYGIQATMENSSGGTLILHPPVE